MNPTQAKIIINTLTQKELEIGHLLSIGFTLDEIAKALKITTESAKAYEASIHRKFSLTDDVSNRIKLARIFWEWEKENE
jgi:DNA-binding CsgD family transcriptional regulator